MTLEKASQLFISGEKGYKETHSNILAITGWHITKVERHLKDLITQKNELIPELSKDNEVLEANEVMNKTDTEPVKPGGAIWTAYMGHIAHSEVEYLVEEMEKLEAPYVMSAEAGKYEHFHFLAKITVKQYHNFCQRVFIKKYKLRGRATKTLPRQYGKVKEIKDLSKMMSYTLKDKNFQTNMSTEDIEVILKKKINECDNTKQESREIKEKMIRFVDNYVIQYLTKAHNRHEKYIRISIIQFMIENHINIRRTTIEGYYWYYVANTENEVMKLNSYAIYNEIYDQNYA